MLWVSRIAFCIVRAFKPDVAFMLRIVIEVLPADYPGAISFVVFEIYSVFSLFLLFKLWSSVVLFRKKATTLHISIPKVTVCWKGSKKYSLQQTLAMIFLDKETANCGRNLLPKCICKFYLWTTYLVMFFVLIIPLPSFNHKAFTRYVLIVSACECDVNDVTTRDSGNL